MQFVVHHGRHIQLVTHFSLSKLAIDLHVQRAILNGWHVILDLFYSAVN
ncbi:Uncharacterised protein [Vibrio cholerae]|nr:Uncharacterised protein [Vibrio cholerae]